MRSLRLRLLAAGCLVLGSFFGLAGLTLDRAFQEEAYQGLQERLQAYAVGLVAAAGTAPDGTLIMPRPLPEARFRTPGSGLYAEIRRRDGSLRWRSPSLQGLPLELPGGLEAGEQRHGILVREGLELAWFALGVPWEGAGVAAAPGPVYTFAVAEETTELHRREARFRRRLWFWLAGVALLVLLVQGVILGWELAPMRQVAQELDAVEAGRQERLEGEYPQEMRVLTDRLNALLASQRERLERHRRVLGDLAHSLKTPLAVLRGLAERPPPDLPAQMREPLRRMEEIVAYQLQRAAAAGRQPMAAPVELLPLARRVRASLDKVYRDKIRGKGGMRCELAVPSGLAFHGDPGDLLELLGNLMDNAYKWCRHRVRVAASLAEGPRRLVLEVADDGPGIPEEEARRVLARGVRGSAGGVEGHGLGLAVVADIVQVHGGRLELGRSPWGGALVRLELPEPGGP